MRTSVSPRFMLSFVVLMVAAAGLAVPAWGDHVKGWTVTRIEYGSQGMVEGSICQVGPSTWQEASEASDTAYQFNETGRDEWSVYLRDPSRQVDLQIDLHKGKVFYSDSSTARRELYQIVGSTDAVNGWLVQRVSFSDQGKPMGVYRKVGPTTWEEAQKAYEGKVFRFEETGRDEGAVYLEDRSRGVRIELNLMSRTVYYSDRNETGRVLYDIDEAWSEP